jgi:hypothetical protein
LKRALSALEEWYRSMEQADSVSGRLRFHRRLGVFFSLSAVWGLGVLIPTENPPKMLLGAMLLP